MRGFPLSDLPSPEEVANRGIERIRKAREREEADLSEDKKAWRNRKRRKSKSLRLQYLQRTGRKEMKP